MTEIKPYRGTHTGKQIDDLLDKIPELSSRIEDAVNGADKTYEHVQNNASSEWSITHNMGKYPSVTVVEYYSKEEIIADVKYLDSNSLKVILKEDLKGIAYLN